VLALLVGTCVLTAGPAASAQTPTSAPGTTSTTTAGGAGTTATTAANSAQSDTAIEVTGTVVDRKGTRERDDDEPVEDARIVVTTLTDEEVDDVETDEDGQFALELEPGDYIAALDLDSLDEDVGLPAEGRERIQINPNRSRVITFNLGARQRSVTTFIDRLAQRSLDGANFGLLIAMVAVGLSLIYGTTGLVNFSHGELVTFGAIAAWYLNVDHGLWIVWAAPLAMLAGAAFGALNDVVVWRQLRRRGDGLFAMMVVSIGLGFFLRNLYLYVFGESSRSYGDYFAQRASIDIGPASIAPKTAISMLVSLTVLIGIALLLQFTRTGKAMRAVADNPDLAASSGIDVDAVIRMVWLMGGALAALGGVLYGMDQQVNFRFGFELLLLMFAGITLGGLGTAYGALLGSFVVGMLITVSTLWVPFELKNVGALAVLILILLVRPQGLLGRAERVG
jgi:branched-chain amino acid transport system permease protein